MYEANDVTGFADWSTVNGWKTENRLLINAGTGPAGDFFPVFAPIEIGSVADYAVEAEIRRINPDGVGFGLAVGASEPDAGYAVGVGEGPGDNWRAAIFLLDSSWTADGGRSLVVPGHSYDPGDAWHTYRVTVSDGVLQFWIDGMIMATATGEHLRAGASVGLWSNQTQLEVRSFRVLELGERGSNAVAAATPSDEIEPIPTPTPSATVLEPLPLKLAETAPPARMLHQSGRPPS